MGLGRNAQAAGGVALGLAWASIAFGTPQPFDVVSHRHKPPVELSFERVGGRIYVPGSINGHDLSIVLDTGCSASVLDLGLARQWGLQSKGVLDVQGAGDKLVQGTFLQNTVAEVAGGTIPFPYAIPIEPLSTMEGRHVQAIVGYQFFMTHIVEVDYAKRHLRVFDEDGDPMPTGAEIPLKFDKSLPHMTTKMLIDGQEYGLETMVDTGATTSSLTDRFLTRHPLKVKETPETVIGGGIGGTNVGSQFRPTSITVGGSTFAQPVIGMTETKGGVIGDGSTFDFLMGADFLSRFRVTFDFGHNRMFLEPTEAIAKGFEADKTGMRIYAEGPDLRTFRVKGVLQGSSAAEAGVKADDLIDSIDGRPAKEIPLQDLRELFRSPTPKSWRLGLIRAGKPITIVVQARSII